MIDHPPKRESYFAQAQGHSRVSFSISLPNRLHAELLEVCELNRNASVNEAIADWVAARKAEQTKAPVA